MICGAIIRCYSYNKFFTNHDNQPRGEFLLDPGVNIAEAKLAWLIFLAEDQQSGPYTNSGKNTAIVLEGLRFTRNGTRVGGLD